MIEARPVAPFFIRLTMWVAFGLIFIPLMTVFAYSFIDPQRAGAGFEVSLKWYIGLMRNEAIGQTLFRSLIVAAGVSFVSGVIGTFGAIALDRGSFPGRNLLRALSALPLIMPELVLGLSSLLWFVLLRWSLGMHSIIAAHVTFTVSYVVITVGGRLQEFDKSLEEAAADLGATWWQTFCLVVLPNIWTAVVAGMMMSFVLSFDDFLISFFTSGVNSDTLPLKLYSMIRYGLNREMYALSSLLILVTGLVIVMIRKLFFRSLFRQPKR